MLCEGAVRGVCAERAAKPSAFSCYERSISRPISVDPPSKVAAACDMLFLGLSSSGCAHAAFVKNIAAVSAFVFGFPRGYGSSNVHGIRVMLGTGRRLEIATRPERTTGAAVRTA